jgi:KaiC/GvpD/RAD55 family RecA-like ATPase
MRLSTEPSRRGVQGVPSGIEPIDREWGGLYRGGAYLVYGRAASGRGLLTLRYVKAGLDLGDRCLFVASERFRDLAVEASSIGLDLRRARLQGTVRLTRVPPLVNVPDDEDGAIAQAVADLAALIRREHPERVVVNDFLPFVMFRSSDRFRRAFVEMLEALDGVDSTVLIALPEPANDQSARVVDFVSTKMTGTIHVEPFEYDPSSTERRLTLTPHVGHFGGRVVCRWDLAALVRLPSSPASPPPAPVDRGSAGTTGAEPAGPVPPAPAAAAAPPVPAGPEEPVTSPEPAEPDEPVESIAPAAAAAPPEPVEPAASAEPSPLTEPSPLAEPSPPAEPTPPDPERDAFRARLDRQFERRERGGTPFLLLAMRLDRDGNGATRPFDFEFIIDLVTDSLRSQDSVLVKPDTERLVVWLADSTPDDAQDFFARLRRTLEAEAPQRAGQLLHAVSAIVVPDGRPFQTGGEFLAYALDED